MLCYRNKDDVFFKVYRKVNQFRMKYVLSGLKKIQSVHYASDKNCPFFVPIFSCFSDLIKNALFIPILFIAHQKYVSSEYSSVVDTVNSRNNGLF